MPSRAWGNEGSTNQWPATIKPNGINSKMSMMMPSIAR